MAPSGRSNKFIEARRQGRETIEVLQDDVQIAFWPPETQVRYLITGALNACTAIAIVSPNAAILAHIAPLPHGTTSSSIAPGTNPGPAHVTGLLNRLASLFRNNRQKFDPNQTYVVAGIWNDSPAMADGIRLANTMLQQLGLRPVWQSYAVLRPRVPREEGHTSVVIEAHQRGAMPRVFVNDNQIN